MIIHSEDGLKYDVQWSIKTIQTTQHVITSDQLNTTGAELGPAQPQLVFYILFKHNEQDIETRNKSKPPPAPPDQTLYQSINHLHSFGRHPPGKVAGNNQRLE